MGHTGTKGPMSTIAIYTANALSISHSEEKLIRKTQADSRKV